ncbi:MAG: glycosyltransferase [Clostridiaceae bacterium]|nr:glycosyltransferase [Clostridiaceae bacterium]
MLTQIAKEQALLKQIRENCNKCTQSGVSIIVPTNKSKYINNIFKNYTRSNYPYIELIIILNNNKLNINDYKIKSLGLENVRIFQLDESYTLGECLNFGVEQSRYNYISKMDDDDYYGANYLIDLMNVFNYTDAQVTGKMSHFVYFEATNTLSIREQNNENRYVDFLSGNTILFKKDIFEKVKFKKLNCGEDVQFSTDCITAGIKIYSADKYNYIYMKHRDLIDHTWQVSSEDLIKDYCMNLRATTDLIPLIIV